MKQVLYPGHAGQPCIGEYAIAIDRTDLLARADVVLISRQAHHGSSFLASSIGRDIVVNRILANDLAGIRLEWIRLFVLIEKERTSRLAGRTHDYEGVELRIELDTDDFIARGNRCSIHRPNFVTRLFTGVSRRISWWSGDVLGGCARVTTSLTGCRHLDPDGEVRDLCQRIGLQTDSMDVLSTDNDRSARATAMQDTLSSAVYH